MIRKWAIILLICLFLPVAARGMNAEERALGESIELFERAFLEFGEKIEPKIREIPDDKLRNNLRLPFIIVRKNTANPNRNIFQLYRELGFEKDKPGSAAIQLKNPNFFFYGFYGKRGAEDPQLLAAYSPVKRTMLLPPAKIFLNTLDLLVFFHECYHVTQDTLDRIRISDKHGFEEYLRFYKTSPGEKPRIVLNYEATAYGYEIELLDLLLDGALSHAINKKAPFNVKAAAKKLGIKDNNHNVINLLVRFAQTYYPHRMEKGSLSERFMRRVASHYNQYYDLYTITQYGFQKSPF